MIMAITMTIYLSSDPMQLSRDLLDFYSIEKMFGGGYFIKSSLQLPIFISLPFCQLIWPRMEWILE